MSSDSALPSRLWARLLYVASVLGVLAIFFAMRSQHGLHFPTPWPDEGSFLWQAINLAEHGTLFAPELNPDRHILWMPPGYMVVTGVVFAVFGFSFELARLLSGIFIAGTAVAVAALLSKLRYRIGYVVVLLVYLAGPVFQLAANTARMESLIICMASVSAVCLARGRAVAGLALAGLTPLVHPNGLFPLLVFTMLAGVRIFGDRRLPAVRRWEWGFVGAFVVAYGAYAAYVLAHAAEFWLDMKTQLVWKDAESQMNGGVLERASQPEGLGMALIWMAAVGVNFWKRRHAANDDAAAAEVRATRGALLALGGAFVLQSLITVGWLYDLYAAFAFAMVTIAAVDGSVGLFDRSKRLVRLGVVGAGFAAVWVASFWAVHLPFFRRSLARSTVIRASGPAYFEVADRQAVLRYLVAASMTKQPLAVQFVPAADSLLYADIRSERIHILQQTRYDGLADVYVFHDSAWIPDELRQLSEVRIAFQQGIATPVSDWVLIHEREGTETWRAYRRH